MKQFFPKLVWAEKWIMQAIAKKFGLEEMTDEERDIIKEHDTRLLMDERLSIMTDSQIPWEVDVTRLGVRVVPWPPGDAKTMFIKLFRKYFDDE